MQQRPRIQVHAVVTRQCPTAAALYLPCICQTAFCVCRAFGPSAAAAQLEGSKAFLKVLLVLFLLVGLHRTAMPPCR